MARQLPLIPVGRKSSKEDPVISYERQLAATTSWGERTGTPLLPFVWEASVSGSKHWRTRGLGEAIAACDRGEAGGIVVEEQNRLQRENMLATAEVWEALNVGGHRLVCIADGLDTDVGDQELNFGVRALLAREQWKQYARRMDNVKATRIAKGIHISGKVPFGYRRPTTGAKLVVDKVEARIIRRAFTMRAAGKSLGEIQRYLEQATGQGWGQSRVKYTLRNRVYLGEARQGKYVNPKGHKALVTQSVFDVVQAKFQTVGSAHRSDATHLLSGIACCASCSYGMRRTRTGGRYFVYRCNGRMGATVCTAPTSIMADALEAFVVDAWCARMEMWGVETSEVEPDLGLEDLHARLAAARNALAPFEDPDYVAAIGLEAAKRGARKAVDKVERLEDELAQRVSANGHHDDAPAAAEALRLFDAATTNEQREFLAGAMEAVTVSRAPRGAALIDRVHIHWVGDGTAPARPSRGRPRKSDAAKVEAGVATA